jgi:hypothetical protein
VEWLEHQAPPDDHILHDGTNCTKDKLFGLTLVKHPGVMRKDIGAFGVIVQPPTRSRARQIWPPFPMQARLTPSMLEMII